MPKNWRVFNSIYLVLFHNKGQDRILEFLRILHLSPGAISYKRYLLSKIFRFTWQMNLKTLWEQNEDFLYTYCTQIAATQSMLNYGAKCLLTHGIISLFIIVANFNDKMWYPSTNTARINIRTFWALQKILFIYYPC